MDLEDIAKHYEKMSDSQFINLITTRSAGLRPEVYDLINNEIKKRNLNPQLFDSIMVQNKEFSIEEIEEYANLLRNLPCPGCGSIDQKLNGTITHTIKSFILFSIYNANYFIACPKCLNKKNNKAMLSTSLLGWWGFPWGFFKTPLYIYRNYKNKKENKWSNPNNAILSYTLENIGKIEAYKDNKKMLINIINS